MFAVSASRTMKNAKPKFREDDVIVRDLVQIREERRREASEALRMAKVDAALRQRVERREAIEALRQEEFEKHRAYLAEAQRRRAEYLASIESLEPVKVHTFADIEFRAMRVFRLTKRELYSRSRAVRIAFARQFIMYWACRLTLLSSPKIGQMMGGLDHTSVLSGKKNYPKKRAKMGRYLRSAR